MTKPAHPLAASWQIWLPKYSASGPWSRLNPLQPPDQCIQGSKDHQSLGEPHSSVSYPRPLATGRKAQDIPTSQGGPHNIGAEILANRLREAKETTNIHREPGVRSTHSVQPPEPPRDEIQSMAISLPGLALAEGSLPAHRDEPTGRDPPSNVPILSVQFPSLGSG